MVECVSGAAIMFRAFFLRALRHIDERYGTYGSSIEICAQMRRAAKKIVILHSRDGNSRRAAIARAATARSKATARRGPRHSSASTMVS